MSQVTGARLEGIWDSQEKTKAVTYTKTYGSRPTFMKEASCEESVDQFLPARGPLISFIGQEFDAMTRVE